MFRMMLRSEVRTTTLGYVYLSDCNDAAKFMEQ